MEIEHNNKSYLIKITSLFFFIINGWRFGDKKMIIHDNRIQTFVVEIIFSDKTRISADCMSEWDHEMSRQMFELHIDTKK